VLKFQRWKGSKKRPHPRVLKVMPTSPTVRCAKCWEIQNTLLELLHSTMGIHSRLRWANSNRIHGDSTTFSAMSSSGALSQVFRNPAVAHTTMALRCAGNRQANGTRKPTAAMPTSGSASLSGTDDLDVDHNGGVLLFCRAVGVTSPLHN